MLSQGAVLWVRRVVHDRLGGACDYGGLRAQLQELQARCAAECEQQAFAAGLPSSKRLPLGRQGDDHVVICPACLCLHSAAVLTCLW